LALKSIRKQNIGDVVYEQFMNAIVSGEWEQGEKIPSENELAATLGVSRVSVRSALNKLGSLGLVESRQGEGTFICKFSGAQYINNLVPIIVLSKPDLKNLLEFRMIFDCEMAGLAAQRADSEIIELMKSNIKEHKRLKGEVKKAAECDLEFHYLIAQATGNPLLIQVYRVLKDVLVYALYDIVESMGTSNALVFHQHILNAIEAGDASRARKVMMRHVLDTMDGVIEGKCVPAEQQLGPPDTTRLKSGEKDSPKVPNARKR
jgi:GntR family transcriptional repressor for pyruvate dehydrogenase complex